MRRSKPRVIVFQVKNKGDSRVGGSEAVQGGCEVYISCCTSRYYKPKENEVSQEDRPGKRKRRSSVYQHSPNEKAVFTCIEEQRRERASDAKMISSPTGQSFQKRTGVMNFLVSQALPRVFHSDCPASEKLRKGCEKRVVWDAWRCPPVGGFETDWGKGR